MCCEIPPGRGLCEIKEHSRRGVTNRKLENGLLQFPRIIQGDTEQAPSVVERTTEGEQTTIYTLQFFVLPPGLQIKITIDPNGNESEGEVHLPLYFQVNIFQVNVVTDYPGLSIKGRGLDRLISMNIQRQKKYQHQLYSNDSLNKKNLERSMIDLDGGCGFEKFRSRFDHQAGYFALFLISFTTLLGQIMLYYSNRAQ